MSKKPTNITEASRETANLPKSCECRLSDGRTINIRRLNWLEFEAVWTELSAVLAALLAADDKASPENLAAELNGAPASVLKLASLSAGISEQEMTGWHYDDVLAVAAASLRFSFISSKGLQDFFLVLADIGKQTAAAGN